MHVGQLDGSRRRPSQLFRAVATDLVSAILRCTIAASISVFLVISKSQWYG